MPGPDSIVTYAEIDLNLKSKIYIGNMHYFFCLISSLSVYSVSSTLFGGDIYVGVLQKSL